MTKLTSIIFPLSIICLLPCCHNNEKDRKNPGNSVHHFDSIVVPLGNPVIVTGIIRNRNVYPQVKEVSLEVPDFKGYEAKLSKIIGSDDSFKFKFYPITTREIILKPIADVVIVHPGDSIFIEKDFKEIGNAKFSGDASELNNNVYKFLNGSYLGRYDNKRYNFTPADYKIYCENYRKEAYARLTTFREKNKITEEFLAWANTNIDIDYYSALVSYLYYNKLLSGSTSDTPNNYYIFLDELNKQFNNSIICSNYFTLIHNYFNYYIVPSIILKYRSRPRRDHVQDSLFLNEISNFSKNDLLNQFVLSHQLNSLLNIHETDMFEENKGIITIKIKEPFLLKTLSDRYKYVKDFNTNPKNLSNSMLGKSDQNNESTGFISKGPMRKELVNTIIDGNRNQVIYIDFWSVGCPPCIPELKLSKKLINKYQGQDIKFVFISFSDSVIAMPKIRELNIGGEHYFCNLEECLYFQNKFGFQAIPHYVLINKEGFIVDFGTSLRPSNPRTIEKIEKLLKE